MCTRLRRWHLRKPRELLDLSDGLRPMYDRLLRGLLRVLRGWVLVRLSLLYLRRLL